MTRRSVDEWRQLATAAVEEFVTAERAFTVPELEAKMADRAWGDFPRINPHHLTTGRLRLEDRGLITTARRATRGGGYVATSVATTGGTKEAERRAARKRLLYTRYLGWTRVSSDWDPAPIPSALERVVQASLSTAAAHGYRLVRPEGGEVRKLFGARVPGGPMDNAAYYSAILDSGMPGPTTLVLIEAKNIRQWVYPRTQEMYQLLNKAVSLQVEHPEVRFAPVLVCRRIHPTTAAMAQQVGFHLIETKTQYVRPVVRLGEDGERKFDEVDRELGFQLTAHEESVVPMVRQFTATLPGRIDEVSERWAAFAQHPDVPDLIARLRDDEISNAVRHESVAELGSCAEEVTGEATTWTNTERF